MKGRPESAAKAPDDKVHLVLKCRTREALRCMGRMDDDFDSVIWRLIMYYRNSQSGETAHGAEMSGETQQAPCAALET